MEPSPEIVAVIRGWFEAVQLADPAWVDRHVSSDPGTRLIGTDPDELLSGVAVVTFLRNEATALKGRAELEPGVIEAFAEGDVGWGFARPVVTFAGQDPVSPRWTAVFRSERGEWRLVQLHASIAINNDDVGFEDHD